MPATATARLPYREITVAAAARQGLAPRRIAAEALHAFLPADGSITPVWERLGNIGGVVFYGITHFRRYESTTSTGVEVVREDGTPVIRFPLGRGRTVRILGRAA